jgi:hypothetical protein
MEYVSGNIFVRPNFLEKTGDNISGHEHNFDHTSFVTRGSIHVVKWRKLYNDNGARMVRDGQPAWLQVEAKDFSAGSHFLVKAEERHEITALEDNSEFACIYSHRTPQGDVVQAYSGWDRAYASAPAEIV